MITRKLRVALGWQGRTTRVESPRDVNDHFMLSEGSFPQGQPKSGSKGGLRCQRLKEAFVTGQVLIKVVIRKRLLM